MKIAFFEIKEEKEFFETNLEENELYSLWR